MPYVGRKTAIACTSTTIMGRDEFEASYAEAAIAQWVFSTRIPPGLRLRAPTCVGLNSLSGRGTESDVPRETSGVVRILRLRPNRLS